MHDFAFIETRSKMIARWREILDGMGFLEVYTPRIGKSFPDAKQFPVVSPMGDYLVTCGESAMYDMLKAAPNKLPGIYQIMPFFRKGDHKQSVWHTDEFLALEWVNRAKRGLPPMLELADHLVRAGWMQSDSGERYGTYRTCLEDKSNEEKTRYEIMVMGRGGQATEICNCYENRKLNMETGAIGIDRLVALKLGRWGVKGTGGSLGP